MHVIVCMLGAAVSCAWLTYFLKKCGQVFVVFVEISVFTFETFLADVPKQMNIKHVIFQGIL